MLTVRIENSLTRDDFVSLLALEWQEARPDRRISKAEAISDVKSTLLMRGYDAVEFDLEKFGGEELDTALEWADEHVSRFWPDWRKS
jgi:hypothetical protein